VEQWFETSEVIIQASTISPVHDFPQDFKSRSGLSRHPPVKTRIQYFQAVAGHLTVAQKQGNVVFASAVAARIVEESCR
jgi:hypothetical protein